MRALPLPLPQVPRADEEAESVWHLWASSAGPLAAALPYVRGLTVHELTATFARRKEQACNAPFPHPPLTPLSHTHL